MARSTIFDVAKRSGVSIKTVSRVMNREPNVRAATQERVLKAVKELKYRPDQSARNLASHRSHLIGLVYDDPDAYELPSGGYILDLQQGALRACRSALSELLIHPCNYRKKNVVAELKSLIEQTRLSGIIVAAPLSNMPKIIRAIESTGTPFVRLSPGKKKLDEVSVATNDFEVCSEMTHYLAKLGHQRIAFIKGNEDHEAVANRFLGYKAALSESGLPFSEKLVAAGDNSFGSGEACATKLLKSKNPPTAIFAANDDMAAGVLRQANHLNINVPGQLSIAGFDDIALARQVDPALTTIRQPLVRMAERAVSILINRNGGDGEATGPQCIPATIKIRESTGPAPQ
ncbi:MAG: LacI family DNA-binding transcriptional regulator [Woeseia sp.]|nr:LacI family DNA-binding transcriptional regulator [Woeseia sp.]